MTIMTRGEFKTRLETIIHSIDRADFDKIADIMHLVDEMMEDVLSRAESDDAEQAMIDDEDEDAAFRSE
ncbi:MAG: hypothetical protein A2Y75_05445 [Candidatus Solincola sediminis]|uniref:Uncharacterized protein n=1 Tax=Candidatus Solincola sediminis TaxID=1797199 RepID=A0A1F2WG90_9ACTN|nr:MAG: hypothetical protein A2Y75_05445 [Candidatus Solincola sediminis]